MRADVRALRLAWTCRRDPRGLRRCQLPQRGQGQPRVGRCGTPGIVWPSGVQSPKFGWDRPPLGQPAVHLLIPARKAHAAQLAPQRQAILATFGQLPFQMGQVRIEEAGSWAP